MPHYAVCFDISDDRARDRVGKRLLQCGDRVQRSVFEVRVKSVQELETLRRELRAELEPDDNIRFYRLCLDCRKASQDGDGHPIATFPAVVIV
jgi:CRISPR-associated protein Cas2